MMCSHSLLNQVSLVKTEEFLKQLAIDTQEASKIKAVVQEQAELVNAEQQVDYR